MKKFLTTCAVVALMSGSAMAEEAAPAAPAAQSPVPVIQKIIIEEAPADAAQPAAEAEQTIKAVNEAAREEERMKKRAADMLAAKEKAKAEAAAAAAAQTTEPTPPVAPAPMEAAAPVEAAPLPVVQETAQPASVPEAPAAVSEAAPVEASQEAAKQETPAPAPEAAPAPQETAKEEIRPAPAPVVEQPEPKQAEAAPAPTGPREESPEVKRLNEEQLAKFKEMKAAGQTDDILVQETETVVITGPQPTTMNQVNFADFDLNQDGVLAQSEVGEKLYRLFDLDGNQVIDNIEMKTVNVMTFIPMERETIEVTEYFEGQGEEKKTVSHEEFLETSKLIAYDKDKDGLSPLDFLGKRFNQVDVTNDKVIDLMEWKRAYAELTKKPHEESFRYNG